MAKFISQEELRELMEAFDLRDYFMHLANRGAVSLTKKYPKWFYFENGNQKIAVSKEVWHDFKESDMGGKAIKAVMHFEKLDWLEAVHFIKDFLGKNYSFSEIETMKIQADKFHDYEFFEITKIIKPNNDKLLAYFQKRGISKQTLIDYARQIHFVRQVKGEMKHSFGIGFKNQSGGYDVRNEFMPTKLGVGDFTHLGNLQAKTCFVYEGMCDMFSMIEILKQKKRFLDDFSHVCLNSVSNIHSFIKSFKNKAEIKFLLCLDGDKEGDKGTKLILEAFSEGRSRDIRSHFGICTGGINDLNDYWRGTNPA
ncbi:toprim domain-containing protein [Capnocytophaga canimorsus]|uniref:toprim domain-containing protein n=1 Tax=Capnocytophaga canimorsus TaxID=28188 RepID=UPI0037D0A0C7